MSSQFGQPETTIQEAQRILLRYGHSGLCVVDAEVSWWVISRRDIDILPYITAFTTHVKGYMTTNRRRLPQIRHYWKGVNGNLRYWSSTSFKGWIDRDCYSY